MDSNRKHLDARKLWTIQGTTWKWSPKLGSVREIIEKEEFNYLEAILISCGSNDMDRRDGLDVFQEMIETITMIREKYPDIKIIISEVTPRKDDRDVEVLLCNEKLNEIVCKMQNVIIINHHNLRDENMSMFADAKHIKATCINIFAGNIKTGLRKAFGITRKGRLNYKETNTSSYEYDSRVNQRETGFNAIHKRSDRLKHLAGYHEYSTYDSNNNDNKSSSKELIQKAIEALSTLLR